MRSKLRLLAALPALLALLFAPAPASALETATLFGATVCGHVPGT